MKKLFLLISFAAPLWSLAQSATILPDGIGIPKVTALPTCNTVEKGKQVFHSTTNKMYFCNGTNWQEMTGGGFTIPYIKTDNSAENLLYLENTGVGRAIYGKSVTHTAVRGESISGPGIGGSSDSQNGVVGISNSGSGIYGYSAYGNAGYFQSDSTQPALYVVNDKGAAAYFQGNVKIIKELTVDNNKGIVRSNTSTQQKVVRLTAGLGVNNLAVGAFKDSGNLNYEDFGGTPTVTIGQVINESSTGEWFKVMIIPINVTPTECQLRIVNLSSNAVTMAGNWHILVVGPE
ncbi:hypothetical protein [Emticicia sp. C21]|uniref:hypothetical protein n=1 Tax=Emticicia sp. C21 TaxID=2302915 RepID=UPI0011C0D963|nr:hypothetical protein [Emticicia sp. C21]